MSAPAKPKKGDLVESQLDGKFEPIAIVSKGVVYTDTGRVSRNVYFVDELEYNGIKNGKTTWLW
jgi:hypothetical protein